MVVITISGTSKCNYEVDLAGLPAIARNQHDSDDRYHDRYRIDRGEYPIYRNPPRFSIEEIGLFWNKVKNSCILDFVFILAYKYLSHFNESRSLAAGREAVSQSRSADFRFFKKINQ